MQLNKTAPTPNLSPVMNRRLAGLRAQVGKPPPLAPQRPPNPAKQDLAARQHRLLQTAEGGDELYKQYSAKQAAIPLAQALAQLAARQVPPVASRLSPRIVPGIKLPTMRFQLPPLRPLPPPSAQPLKIKTSKLAKLLREFGIDMFGAPLPKQSAYLGGFLTKLAFGPAEMGKVLKLVKPNQFKLPSSFGFAGVPRWSKVVSPAVRQSLAAGITPFPPLQEVQSSLAKLRQAGIPASGGIILPERGDFARYLLSLRRQLGPELARSFGLPDPQRLATLTPEARKAMDVLVKGHELQEINVPGVLPKSGILGFGVHRSPAVILRESNMLATMPPEIRQQLQPLWAGMRATETNNLQRFYPDFQYGIKRLSRHRIRNIVKQYSTSEGFKHSADYVQGFLTKLAQALGQTDFEELAGLIGPGDWTAKSWTDLKPATQTALTGAVAQRTKTNPNLLRDVQTYTKGPNPYSKLFSPVRHGVYNRVQQPGFWTAATQQFPQLATAKKD